MASWMAIWSIAASARATVSASVVGERRSAAPSAVGRWQHAVEVLADHRGHPRRQVAQPVRELARVDRAHVLPREAAVGAEGDRLGEVVAVRVGAEVLGDHLGRDGRRLRLAHLLAADEQPAVREHRARHVEPGRHQHRRPDDRVEPQDVLADQVDVGRPQTLELLGIGAVAGCGDVVEQRVDPHVEHLAVVPRHLDAPVERRAADRQVVEALLDERDDLVARRLRLHEVRLASRTARAAGRRTSRSRRSSSSR